jgi:hypothetical protein
MASIQTDLHKIPDRVGNRLCHRPGTRLDNGDLGAGNDGARGIDNRSIDGSGGGQLGHAGGKHEKRPYPKRADKEKAFA